MLLIMTKLNKCSPENKSVSPKNLKICLVTFPTSFPGIIAAFIILKFSFHISCRAFDALAAAETAADFPLSFLFNPARLNRMVQNQALYNGLGVDEMIKVLMNKTWHAPRLEALPGLILQQNEQLLQTYLLSVSTKMNCLLLPMPPLQKPLTISKNLPANNCSQPLHLHKDIYCSRWIE